MSADGPCPSEPLIAAGPADGTIVGMTGYRLDRRFVLPAIGLQMIAAGIASVVAFILWWPFGVLAVLLLLNAARMLAWPPGVARADEAGIRLGGPLTVKHVRIEWSEVESVKVDGHRMLIECGGDRTVVFPLAYVGDRANELVRDVYDRLNLANGYTRFEPDA